MAERIEIRGPGELGVLRRPKPFEAWRTVEVEAPDSVRLDTGEYVSKSAFEMLSPTYQAFIKKHGVEAFNIEQEKLFRTSEKVYEEAISYVEKEEVAQEEWTAENIIEVGPEKETILRAVFEKMDPEAQKLIKEVGITEFNKRIEEQEEKAKDFEVAHTQLPDGQWIDNEQLAKLKTEAPSIHRALTTSGFVAADKIIQEQQVAFSTLKGYAVLQAPVGTGLPFEYLLEHYPVGYDLARYLKDYPENSAVLITAGFDPKEVTAAKLASETYGMPVYDISIDEKIKILEPLQFRDEATGKTINIHTLMEREGEGIVDRLWNEINPEWKSNLITAQAQHIKKRQWEIGIIPVVGTVYLWDEMPTWAKAVSIAGDVLFFACLTGVNPIRWVAPKLFERVPKAAAIYEQVVAQNVDDAVRVLGGVDPRLLKPFQGAVNAATKYADDFTRARALQFTIDQCDDILKSGRLAVGSAQHQAVVDLLAQSADDLVRATSRAATSKATLLRLAGEYTDDVIDKLKPSPTYSSTLRDIPGRLVKGIENVAIPPTVDIATLQAQLLTGKNALLAAKTKFPLDPTKWIDLVDEVARLEGKLLNARIGNIQALHSQLLAVRQTLPELEKVLGTLGRGTTQYDEVVSEIARVKRLIETLPEQVGNAIRAMEIEAVQGGFWGGNIAVISPTGTARLATLTTPVTTFELTKTGLLPLTVAIAAKAVVPLTLKPKELSATYGVVAPEIVSYPSLMQVAGIGPSIAGEQLVETESIIATVSDQATQVAVEAFNIAITEGYTTAEAEAAAQTAAQSAIQTAMQQAIQSATANITDAAAQAAAQTAAQTAVEAATQTLVETAVQTAIGITPTPATPVVPVPVSIITLTPRVGEEKLKLTAKQLAEGVTFRQGLIWIVKLPPLTGVGNANVYTMDAPPPSQVYRADVGLPRETVSGVETGTKPLKGDFTIPWGLFNIHYKDGVLDYLPSGKTPMEVITEPSALVKDSKTLEFEAERKERLRNNRKNSREHPGLRHPKLEPPSLKEIQL